MSGLPFTTEDSLAPYQIIDAFTVCFKNILNSPNLSAHIQKVKGDLYNRDYLAAFDDDDKRFAYASRWTPARALAYASLFSSLTEITTLLKEPTFAKNVLCIGAGAGGELCALGAVFARLKEYNPTSSSQLNIDIIDIADWSTVLNQLTSYMKNTWVYNHQSLNMSFVQNDILTCNIGMSKYELITLLFTTNELFAEKRKETVKFLHTLCQNCKKDSLLLIAESAGSFSHITVGDKKFPVQFLIDMILVGKPDENDGAWEVISQQESLWYRVNEKEVTYPLKLENMRFFYRLYRKK
ncbi:uncharacterized protein KGF55_000288 [Candida pseudojiufengensis]|uniref:uncharacterized protein n=1 Tax=Candida pseudojiufengensis TaxID=497109 RepID=UPI00222588FD|nr:uncharacterized protein KGF55_000288 [Candida pseudojiufengensis]KAI5966879.1 hypothetical protein KGF55_000288 [Candida pseudojiufengensis]